METTWPWPCLGCGGPIIRRATGRTPQCCSDKCRSAAWRDYARGCSGPELIMRKAGRRIAREAEPPRITPGEQQAIRYAWLDALSGCAGGNPGLRQVYCDVWAETEAGTWPESFTRAAAAGEMPAYPECAEVIEAVVSERMKLADLAAIRARRDDHQLPRGVTA
jgi:hypothetical protein